ncbi:hypothetical protein FZC79_09945 [Rossellomorea vietnamensis]|uniref:DUF4401 domain-containing protein n=2 Tax=Rossellomorea TaxID=2837508 RepID=A0A5D4KF35_9BACI|nr:MULTISPECIES: hypothetical protein [Rossellomorea]TYR75489.1 hypothetical protein FZC79_09945 [Rossellomorea vietnamensis]TYS83914.1 hypothetical protein FZC80_00045 [Rossellomorea aquimaris]
MNSNNQKTNIIINEILFWKHNKMLPEQYCDYLLALYNQGNEIEDIETGKSRFSSASLIPSILICTLIPISLFVIYFTELSFVLQTAILTGFVVSLIFSGIYYSNKELILPVIYITIALLILLQTVSFADAFYKGDKLITYGLLFFNCLMWLLCGLYRKLLYFTLAGAVGIILLIVSILI